MKFSLSLATFAATILLAGCTATTPAPQEPTVPPTNEAAQPTIPTNEAQPTDDTQPTGDFEAPADDSGAADEDTANNDAAADTAMKTIAISAKRWEYTPSTITVKKGEKVTLMVTDTDTKHGLKFQNMTTTTDANGGIVLDTSKAGTFMFFCPTFCGEGHKTMQGNVIVTE